MIRPIALRRTSLLALTLLAAADPPPPVWQGVWSGTIGALPIRACLVREGDAYAFGSYYYLSTLRPIRLDQLGTSRVWSEGYDVQTGQPRWTFGSVDAKLLTGDWSDGKRKLPFRLVRVASPADEGPCGSEAFNAPRWRPLTLTTKVRHQDGIAYRALSFHAGPAFPDLTLDGFALIGTDAATRRINAALRAHVPGKDEEWRGCVTSGLDAHGVDGDYQVGLTPTLITSRWLAADLDAGEDCGGAHPNSNTTPLTFDRVTGAAVDLDTWLNDAALVRGAGATAPFAVTPALRRLLVRLADPDTDCRDALARADYWDVGLERTGLSFRAGLGHADQACADPVSVPWAALGPYLSAPGRTGRASLAR